CSRQISRRPPVNSHSAPGMWKVTGTINSSFWNATPTGTGSAICRWTTETFLEPSRKGRVEVLPPARHRRRRKQFEYRRRKASRREFFASCGLRRKSRKAGRYEFQNKFLQD